MKFHESSTNQNLRWWAPRKAEYPGLAGWHAVMTDTPAPRPLRPFPRITPEANWNMAPAQAVKD